MELRRERDLEVIRTELAVGVSEIAEGVEKGKPTGQIPVTEAES